MIPTPDASAAIVNGMNSAICRFAHFLACIRDVEGVDFGSICHDVAVHSKACPDLMSITMEGKDFHFQFIDSEQTLVDKGAPITNADITNVIKRYNAVKQNDERMANLVDEIAKSGGVFVESIDLNDLRTLQAIWSDAYGEDRLELYGVTVKQNTFRGYIRTALTPEQIAAMDNVDGPAFKCEPLFPNAVKMN